MSTRLGRSWYGNRTGRERDVEEHRERGADDAATSATTTACSTTPPNSVRERAPIAFSTP